MISLEDWAEIRYLHRSEGLSRRAIAKRLGISRDTVARAIASQTPPKYSRVSGPSAFDPFEPYVRELLAQFPMMPASVIAERVGWSGSQSWWRKKVAGLRPEYAPKDPADRLSYRPGDQAQCDLWFPPVDVPLGAGQVDSPPVLVVVASFSRFVTARMIPTRTTPDLVAGMWSLLDGQLGAVPRRLLWDNESGIGCSGRLVAAVVSFTGMLATKVVQCPPYDPAPRPAAGPHNPRRIELDGNERRAPTTSGPSMRRPDGCDPGRARWRCPHSEFDHDETQPYSGWAHSPRHPP